MRHQKSESTESTRMNFEIDRVVFKLHDRTCKFRSTKAKALFLPKAFERERASAVREFE